MSINRHSSREAYLEEIERLAKAVVEAAVTEASFEVFLEEGPKSALQKAITELARTLRYRHESDDPCAIR